LKKRKDRRPDRRKGGGKNTFCTNFRKEKRESNVEVPRGGPPHNIFRKKRGPMEEGGPPDKKRGGERDRGDLLLLQFPSHPGKEGGAETGLKKGKTDHWPDMRKVLLAFSLPIS